MRLSVAICTYNGALYLKEQLLSIINQNLPVSEIVICDDGSTDDTMEIIESIKRATPEMTWIVSNNNELPLGVRLNFEKALSMCTGEIVLLSDQDDIWLPEKTERIVTYFKFNPDVNLVFSDAYLIDENGASKSSYSLFDAVGLSDLKEQWNAGLKFEIENMGQRLLGCTFGIRKEFLSKSLPFEESIPNLHDGQLAMNAVINDCIGVIEERLIKYRIHGNNVIGLKNNWVFNSILDKGDVVNFLYEPRKVNPFFKLSSIEKFNERVSFYEKRERYYCSVTGKIRLLFSFLSYFKYYGRFALRFFMRDFFYGIRFR